MGIPSRDPVPPTLFFNVFSPLGGEIDNRRNIIGILKSSSRLIFNTSNFNFLSQYLYYISCPNPLKFKQITNNDFHKFIKIFWMQVQVYVCMHWFPSDRAREQESPER
jgi:hypothetical protein